MFEGLHGLEYPQFDHDLDPLSEVVLIEEVQVIQNALLLLDAWLERDVQVLVDDRVLQDEEVEEAKEENFVVVAGRSLLTHKDWVTLWVVTVIAVTVATVLEIIGDVSKRVYPLVALHWLVLALFEVSSSSRGLITVKSRKEVEILEEPGHDSALD